MKYKFNKFWIVLSLLMQKYMILYYIIIFFYSSFCTEFKVVEMDTKFLSADI